MVRGRAPKTPSYRIMQRSQNISIVHSLAGVGLFFGYDTCYFYGMYHTILSTSTLWQWHLRSIFCPRHHPRHRHPPPSTSIHPTGDINSEGTFVGRPSGGGTVLLKATVQGEVESICLLLSLGARLLGLLLTANSDPSYPAVDQSRPR